MVVEVRWCSAAVFAGLFVVVVCCVGCVSVGSSEGRMRTFRLNCDGVGVVHDSELVVEHCCYYPERLPRVLHGPAEESVQIAGEKLAQAEVAGWVAADEVVVVGALVDFWVEVDSAVVVAEVAVVEVSGLAAAEVVHLVFVQVALQEFEHDFVLLV